MDKALAHDLVSVCQGNGLDAELCEDYSGRCMYGRTTTGVIINDGDISDILQAVIENACDFEDYSSIGGIRTDSMGLGTIIY